MQALHKPLPLGPLRLRWIGALLASLGIVLGLAALAGRDDD
jgi:hypothetical protein